MTKRICVTGACGRAGRVTVRELLAHGYRVLATDRVRPSEDLGVRPLLADLTDYGQATEVLQEVDAVVHLANIPAPQIHTPATTFNQNMTMNFNVFMAAAQAQLERVVWASSETTLGLPFDVPPRYAPLDEDHYPVPTSTYALSKVASETVAAQIAEWSQIPFTGLRFSNILGPRTTSTSRSTGRTPPRAGGICGATSTSVTRPWPAGWPSRRPPRAASATSSRPRTP